MGKKKKEEYVSLFNTHTHKNLLMTVKTSLTSILKDRRIYAKINDTIMMCNELIIDTYQFIRLYCLYQYHNGNKLPIFNYEFVSYCMKTLTEKTNTGKPIKNNMLLNELNTFYEKEFQPIYNHTKYKINNLHHVLQYSAISIITCLNNNIKEHYIDRLSKFINVYAREEYDRIFSNVHTVICKEYEKLRNKEIWKLRCAIITNDLNSIPSYFKIWFDSVKCNIMPNTYTKNVAYDCKIRPHKYLRYTLYFNDVFEHTNDLYNSIINNLKTFIIDDHINDLYNDKIINDICDVFKIYNNAHNNLMKNIESFDICINEIKNTHISDINKKINNKVNQYNKQSIKLPQPLSLRSTLIPRYITLDTTCLIDLFCEDNKRYYFNNVKDNEYLIWHKFFNIDNKVFKRNGYKFNGIIQTDGVGVSISFKHISVINKKHIKAKKQSLDLSYIDDLLQTDINKLKTKKIITVDPGKYNIVYMLDENNNKLRYTCCQRDHETKSYRNRHIIKKHKKDNGIIKIETTLSNVCGKTVNYMKFKEYIKVKHDTNLQLKEFYTNRLYRKLKWRSYTYKQHSEDKFINNIKNTYGDNNEIVIVYGDWSRQTQMKNHVPTIGKGMKNIISRQFKTVLINEYNTSKKCCNCSNNLEHVDMEYVVKKNKLKRNKHYRLMVCEKCSYNGNNIGRSENASPIYLTRDMNACKNMLNIIKHMFNNDMKRPLQFTRTNDKIKRCTKSEILDQIRNISTTIAVTPVQ